MQLIGTRLSHPFSRAFLILGLGILVLSLGCEPSDPNDPSSGGTSGTEGENSSPPEVVPDHPTAPGSHVLLITIDTVRTDRLSLYGGPAQVPYLSRIAKSSWVFERAYAPYPLTLPSHTTILSGYEPFEHQVRDNSTFHVPESMPTLAQTLQEQGYQTAAFVSAFVLDRRYGLDRGFDHYDDKMQTRAASIFPAERNAEQTMASAQRWLANADHSKPWFVWIHLYDPHAPYAAPESFSRSPSEHPYDVELRYVDQEIGRLWQWLEKMGLVDRTLSIITADHGEALGEHGEDTHGFLIYEGAMRVPLIIRHPKLEPGVFPAPVGLHQIAPTVLSFLECPLPEPNPKRPHLLVPQGKSPKSVYLENYATWYGYGLSPLESLVQGDWKLVHSPKDELYNLGEDPAEQNDLAEEQAGRAQEMLESLESYKNSGVNIAAPSRSPMSADERAALEALGYVVSSAGMESVPVGQGLNPKEHVSLLDSLEEIDKLLAVRSFPLAAAMSEKLTETYPRLERGLAQYAISLYALGKLEPACDVARRILAINPDRTDARLNLGRTLFRMESYDEAIVELNLVREKGEKGFEVFAILAQSYVRLDRKPEALKVLHEALDGVTWNAQQRQRLEAMRQSLE